MENPILQTVNLVEDRIAEILESGEHIAFKSSDKMRVERSITAHGKLVFLQRISKGLKRFYDGNF